ncbi:MAG TPA: phosphate ABC transporter permease subunit PstC, partial [Actinomycetota bacterium]|nr:phosphate ABC transporter permease subunit PstC [Actinomycetota bacterium]
MHGLLGSAAGVSMVISLAIVVALLGQAIVFLSNVELGALWSERWRPRSGEFDILTLFIGTFEVSVIAMLIATPLGLGAAMYLSEYANPR